MKEWIVGATVVIVLGLSTIFAIGMVADQAHQEKMAMIGGGGMVLCTSDEGTVVRFPK